jgi:hypothetical protein
MKTYDQIVVDKLEEIQPATMKELSEALGYKNSKDCFHLMKNLIKNKKIFRDATKRPYRYKINQERG